jgi:putative membrane protein
MDYVQNLTSFATYVSIGGALLLLGVVLFSLTTKFSEVKLINEGNVAVALKLYGKVLGLAIVIYSAFSNSLNVVDALIWGGIGIATQIIVYLVIEYVFTPKTNLAKKVEEGNIAIGLSLFVISVAVGLVIAGSLTY